MELSESFDKHIQDYRYHRSEKYKWMPILLGAVLAWGAASGIKELIVRNADYLGGKETVKTFFLGNIVKLAILLIAIAAFIVVFTKTWKGRASSIEQLVFTLGGGGLLVVFALMTIPAVMNIGKELKSPKTAEISSYTLCTDSSGNYFAAFDDSDGGVLLQIPDEAFDELSEGEASERGSGFAYNELSEDGSGYQNVTFYRSDAKVTYYQYSVIYKSAKLIR